MAQSKPIDLGVNVGDVILDKYRVESILGAGGMGVVAQCIHLQLGERVAIKMLRPDVLRDSDAVERFQREAQAAAKLRSEYVARVTDVGTFSATHVPYMVMEFLEGNDLDQLIQERGHLPVPWSVELMLQAAEALAEAHSINIVHRDVKPSNLFVTWRPDGSAMIKVLDFGISKSPTGADMQLTQTQSLLGTPAYMSPEQMRSARLVDSRSDIWSLGTVMYEVIEGRRPFVAESFSEMCVKVAVDEPAPMTLAPPALQQVILRCLAKTPEQRYSSMAELGRDLIPFAPDQHQGAMLVERMLRMLRRSHGGDWDISSGAVVPLRDRSAPVSLQQPAAMTPHPGSLQLPAALPPAPPDDLAATTYAPPRPRSSNRRIAAIALVLVAIIGGIAIGKLAARSDDPVSPPAATASTQTPIVMPMTAVDAGAAAPVATPDAAAIAAEAPPDPSVVVEDPKAVKKPPIIRRVEPAQAIKRPTTNRPTGTAKTVPKPKEPEVVGTPPPPPPRRKCDVFDLRDGGCDTK